MHTSFYDLYCEEVEKNRKVSSDLQYLKNENLSLHNRIHYLENTMQESIQKAVDSAVSQVSMVYEKKIDKLNHKISHMESLLKIDSSNTGIPTGMTPLNKEKRIPNTREATDKNIGGQIGHKKHKLEKFDDEEVSVGINHKVRTCAYCGEVLDSGNIYTSKDELEFEVQVKKIRHYFYAYTCPSCGKSSNIKVPNRLKEENQYGTNVQAVAVTLMNQGYVSMNRTREIISGLTQNEITLSEGFLA